MKKIVALALVLALAFALCACGNSQYKQAERLYTQGDYAQAAELYEAAGNYKDSAEKAKECRYQLAIQAFNRGEYQDAKAQFQALGGYSDSSSWIDRCDEEILNERCGTYNLTGLKIDGTDYSAYISALGYDDYKIIFKSDKTGSLRGGGSNVTFTWTATTLNDGYATYEYTYNGSQIYLASKGVEMTFTR